MNANKQKNKNDGEFQSQVYTIVEQIIDAKWYIDIITNDICMDMVSLVVERVWETATAHNPSRLMLHFGLGIFSLFILHPINKM